MQYALDHPDLVHSIYSLGTPYAGSTSASLDLNLLGSKFAPADAERDITDKNVYEKYMLRWNNNYEELYSNINVVALGGYSTLQGLLIELTSDSSIDYYEELIGIDKNKASDIIVRMISTLIATIVIDKFASNKISDGIILSTIKLGLSELFLNCDLNSTRFDDLIQILKNEINLDYHPPFISWYNDGLVDLGSQLGYDGLVPSEGKGYKGFKTFVKVFTGTNANLEALSAGQMPAVVHNLEARDKDLGTHILSDISVGLKLNNDYEYYVKPDNTIIINSYIGNTTSSTINIPSYINGKKVNEIDECAFSNNLHGNSTVDTIVIPDTIEKIGKSAFENCTNLNRIVFSDNSLLRIIEESAFYGCTNMYNISIPMQVEKIGDYAFADCVTLSGIFTLPDNLIELGKNVFLTTYLSGIAISGNNANFCVSNATLYNKAKTKLIISYVSGAFDVPNTVTKINEYAFYNNSNLTSINLNNVMEINDYAFLNCTDLRTINGDNNVRKANIKSFYSTKWIENKDLITLGSVLLRFSLENITNYEIPNDITCIGEDAFNSNGLSTVYFNPNSQIQMISNRAFTNCSNLNNIYILNNNQPIIYSNSFPRKNNLKIYVPSLKEEQYKRNSLYTSYLDNISTN